MQGEQSNEEKLQLEAKIQELTSELDEKTNTHNLLRLQIKRLQVRCWIQGSSTGMVFWNESNSSRMMEGEWKETLRSGLKRELIWPAKLKRLTCIMTVPIGNSTRPLPTKGWALMLEILPRVSNGWVLSEHDALPGIDGARESPEAGDQETARSA